MAVPVKRALDFENRNGIINLAAGTATGHPVTFEQMNALIQGLSWKDNARAASTANVTLSAPGATIDGVTMVSGDRFLAKNQTTTTEMGIYVWNGAAAAATRATDSDTFDMLENAVIMIDEGTTNAGTAWRQTAVNGIIGSNSPVFTSFSTAAAATETTAGIAEVATQAETDTGTDDARMVTPLKLKNWTGALKRFSTNIGDGSSTSLTVTHNLNTQDTSTTFREVSGSLREVIVEAQHTSVNVVTALFDAAPAASTIRATVLG